MKIAFNRGLFWLAFATTLTTFPLIFMGGLVTTKDAGLSVPDWPNSYGYNMFLFPPNKWVANIFFEHVHRLIGTLVGFFAVWTFFWAFGVGQNRTARKIYAGGMTLCAAAAIGLSAGLFLFFGGTVEEKLQSQMAHIIVGVICLLLFLFTAWTSRRREERSWVRYLSLWVLLGVIGQGVLGGLRVTMVKLDLAVIHGCVAQVFFCLSALLALAASKWWAWIASPDARAVNPAPRPMGGLITLATFAWLIVFGQLILGATMRHYRAGLSIPDLPTSYGEWLPPLTETELDQALARAPAPEFEDDDTPVPVARLTRVWLAYGHRLGAVAVALVAIWLASAIYRKHLVRGLSGPAAILLILIQLQVTLGVLVVLGIPVGPPVNGKWALLKKPADITSYHVAVGALVLLTTFVILARAIRVRRVNRVAQIAELATNPGAAYNSPSPGNQPDTAEDEGSYPCQA